MRELTKVGNITIGGVKTCLWRDESLNYFSGNTRRHVLFVKEKKAIFAMLNTLEKEGYFRAHNINNRDREKETMKFISQNEVPV